MTKTEKDPTGTEDRPTWEIFTNARHMADEAQEEVVRAIRVGGDLDHAIEAHVFAIRVQHAAMAAWNTDLVSRHAALSR